MAPQAPPAASGAEGGPGPRRATTVTILLAVALSAAYFLLVAVFAHKKVLWTDELFTVIIATQPTLSAVFDGLLEGPDVLPPFNHLLTRLSVNALGASHLAYRLPAAVGFWIAMAAVYAFLRPRAGVLVAYAGALTLLSVEAFAYAYEARPYGLVMGCSALSVLCWQRATASARWPWYVGTAGSLLGAIASHWYGALALVPLAVGELTRARRSRRVDVAMLAALAAGTVPALLLYPFARQAMTFRGMTPPPGSLGDYLSNVYGLTGGVVLVVLVLAWVVTWALQEAREQRAGAWPLHEVAAASAAGLLPLAAFVLGQLSGGQSAPRYALSTGIGVSLLVGLAVHSQRRATLRGAVTLTLLVAAAINVTSHKRQLTERTALLEARGEYSLLAVDVARLDELPLVVVDLHAFMPLHYYAETPLRERLVYVAGPNVMAAQSLQNLAKFYPIRVLTRTELRERHPVFYVYEHGSRTPLVASFLAQGAVITDSGVNDTRDVYPRPGYLYRVDMSAARAPVLE